jgi:hypothetical protein
VAQDSKTPPVSGLRQDRSNANKGTKRGRALLEESLRKHGAGRSILADKHGTIIAGNKTLETAEGLGLSVRIVESDGTELVVVQRTDLDLERDPAARKLAYADNRVGQVDLQWDVEQMQADLNTGIDLQAFWHQAELDVLLAVPSTATSAEAFQPTLAPQTSTALTSAEDVQQAQQNLDDKFKPRLHLRPIVCPHCAGEFFLDAEKAE